MIQFISLALLLGFELSYYLLIIQTGIAQHYHSDLLTLLPLFVGGITGSLVSGHTWAKITNPLHKISISLCLQLILSLLYPEYSPFSLFLLGLSVGVMAPLSIYIFQSHQKRELFFALGIAYSVGTYGFAFFTDSKEEMAIIFTCISLISSFFLSFYKIQLKKEKQSLSIMQILPFIVWIVIDSNLFESLIIHQQMNLWLDFNYLIIVFHILGLMAAYLLSFSHIKHHLFIFILFILSYVLFYLEIPLYLAMIYPFTVSYYNMIVFNMLSKEASLKKLSIIMVFIAWIGSGLGLVLALR
ncbi:MAG TPA: hypothetical protein EYO73_08845 [Sulfurimonas sp.]|nr:hypothetical protein [Sulfurimonas sp.]